MYVQETAGNGSGFSDSDYMAAGAKMLATIAEVYAIAEMIIKVKDHSGGISFGEERAACVHLFPLCMRARLD